MPPAPEPGMGRRKASESSRKDPGSFGSFEASTTKAPQHRRHIPAQM